MFDCPRQLLLWFATGLTASAAPPPALASALAYLREQKSYSWEVINADPGPVAQQLETRRGKVTLVGQNNSPHIKGSIDRSGDTLIQRQWADGLRLDTIITADGTTVTNTPEGWMTNQEILTALADERLKAKTATPRLVWLLRADRPELNRPDQELGPLLNSAGGFEAGEDSYLVRGRLNPNGDAGPAIDVAVTINLSSGIIRDYEVKIDSTRRVSRARLQVPISEQRIVILTYLPVRKVEIPDEARAKLQTAALKG